MAFSVCVTRSRAGPLGCLVFLPLEGAEVMEEEDIIFAVKLREETLKALGQEHT